MFVTYTVTVDANGSAADPSGTVSVSDANGACPTNPVSLSDGPSAGESTASCTIQEDTAEPSGETVTASYSGDSNYNAVPPGFGTTVTATYTPATTDNNYNGNTGTFTETVNP